MSSSIRRGGPRAATVVAALVALPAVTVAEGEDRVQVVVAPEGEETLVSNAVTTGGPGA